MNHQKLEKSITKGIKFIDGGLYGNDAKYMVNKETIMLIIKGRGKKNDYNPNGSDVKCSRFNRSTRKLFVLWRTNSDNKRCLQLICQSDFDHFAEGILSISARSFEGCIWLASMNFSNSLIEIGESMFECCVNGITHISELPAFHTKESL